MKSKFSVLVACIVVSNVYSQLPGDWLVGTPLPIGYALQFVDAQTIANGCYPDPDYVLMLPTSQVTGVDYVFQVVSANPPGSIIMTPGPANPLVAGDSYILPFTGGYTIYMPAGTGSLAFIVRAIGTPTVAGQPHPCGQQFFPWNPDGNSCPISLSSSAFNNGCTTYTNSGNGVYELDKIRLWFSQPSPANNFELQVLEPQLTALTVLDVAGRSVVSVAGNIQPIAMGSYPYGIYTVRAVGAQGELHVARFVLAP